MAWTTVRPHMRLLLAVSLLAVTACGATDTGTGSTTTSSTEAAEATTTTAVTTTPAAPAVGETTTTTTTAAPGATTTSTTTTPPPDLDEELSELEDLDVLIAELEALLADL